MASFSAAWLALREPADRAARAAAVTRFVAEALGRRAGLRVLDLGAGTGANLRYLAERLTGDQFWTLVDHDQGVLAAVRARMHAWAPDAAAPSLPQSDGAVLTLRAGEHRCRIAVEQHDLRALDSSLFEGVHLVTAAALLDLASETWIDGLVQCCRAAGAAALFALSYDGRVACDPREPEDDTVVALVNRHQRTDKGFGPAAGPSAADAAAHSLARAGYDVRRGPSDWVLGPQDAELQRQLVAGWAEAAIALDPSQASAIRGWQARRLLHVVQERSTIRVGHEDLGAVPR